MFEWLTDKLGAQNAICSGGRYDSLVEQLGGKPTQAVGWALGIERVIELMKQAKTAIDSEQLDLFLVSGNTTQLKRAAFCLSEELRDTLNGVKLAVYCGEAGIKSQMKKADKSGARFAIILGEDELASSQVVFKDLRKREAQESIARSELTKVLSKHLAS